jgi:hypothetical protein
MSLQIKTIQRKNNKGSVVDTVFNITKKAKGKTISFKEANDIYKEYKKGDERFVVKAMTKLGWTTLKAVAYNEDELREYDDDYFMSSGGSKSREPNEVFLGLQFIVQH